MSGRTTGASVGDGAVNVFSNSRRANASSAHVAGVSVGTPGVLLAASGLKIAVTNPDARRVTAVITGDIGFAVDSVVHSLTYVALDNVCVDAFGGDAEPPVASGRSAIRLACPPSVVSVRVSEAGGVASFLASATADSGAGVFFLVGLPADGSDRFDVAGLLVRPSWAEVPGGAAVLLGGGSVADAESSRLRPPVPTTTPAGAERTAPSLVTEPFVPVVAARVVVVAPVSTDFAVSCAASALAVAGCVSEEELAVVDPGVPPDSSAHARPPPHPVTMAAPTPNATAMPPTRPTYAWLGMRYVYRPWTIGRPEMRKSIVCRRRVGAPGVTVVYQFAQRMRINASTLILFNSSHSSMKVHLWHVVPHASRPDHGRGDVAGVCCARSG